MASHLAQLYTLLCELSDNPERRKAVMSRISAACMATLKNLSRTTLAIREFLASWLVASTHAKETASQISTSTSEKSDLDEFRNEVQLLLEGCLNPAALLDLSLGLKEQFKTALLSNPACMLPSFNHQLPHGHERGTFLALDVGGSTLRIALIDLRGPEMEECGMVTLSSRSYKITNVEKQLVGLAFFDWMAARIDEALVGQAGVIGEVLSAGLAWSFPIEQTSLRSGMMQGMGKGFLAAEGLLGQDLADVLQQACERKNLNIRVSAIVNDSTATLLSKAYTDPTTRFGLILGTGVNVAIHLPTSSIGASKFGTRSSKWHAAAQNVLVNTELGMFGKDILPVTRWDVLLNEMHMRPDFQPFEHLTSGRYLGEIARLIILEGTRSAGLFGGILPSGIDIPYGFETELMSGMQSASNIDEARTLFLSQHPCSESISDADVSFLQTIAISIASRSAAIIATSIHALWQLRNKSLSTVTFSPQSTSSAMPLTPPSSASPSASTSPELSSRTSSSGPAGSVPMTPPLGLSDNPNMPLRGSESSHIAIACNGSVIQHYPGFMKNCQQHLDMLVEHSGGQKGALELEIALESSLCGAAVAVACVGSDGL